VWPVAKLYAIAQIDDGQWETLRPAFQAAGFDMGGRQRARPRARGAGPETATVALDVRPYSAIQRQALLAHRTQIPPDSFWGRLPPELYRRAFATAYCLRLHPPAAPGEYEQDLFCRWQPIVRNWATSLPLRPLVSPTHGIVRGRHRRAKSNV
jgi:hypothetical protein